MSTAAIKVDREKVEREYRAIFQDGPPPILQILFKTGGDDPEEAWRVCEQAVGTGVKPVGTVPDGMDI